MHLSSNSVFKFSPLKYHILGSTPRGRWTKPPQLLLPLPGTFGEGLGGSSNLLEPSICCAAPAHPTASTVLPLSVLLRHRPFPTVSCTLLWSRLWKESFTVSESGQLPMKAVLLLGCTLALASQRMQCRNPTTLHVEVETEIQRLPKFANGMSPSFIQAIVPPFAFQMTARPIPSLI